MSNSLKIVLIIVVVSLVLIIGGGIYYLSQETLPEEPPEEGIKTPPPKTQVEEEEFNKKNPDFVEGIIKFEAREYQGESYKIVTLLTEDEITYYVTPSNEAFYQQKGINDGDKVEIQGRIAKIRDQDNLLIGRITKK